MELPSLLSILLFLTGCVTGVIITIAALLAFPLEKPPSDLSQKVVKTPVEGAAEMVEKAFQKVETALQRVEKALQKVEEIETMEGINAQTKEIRN